LENNDFSRVKKPSMGIPGRPQRRDIGKACSFHLGRIATANTGIQAIDTVMPGVTKE
jgi:hypothetical protein